MTISGLSPYAALSGSMPLAQSTATPLGSARALPGMPLNGASAGAVERPGIGTRLMSAMRAAISELRGTPTGGQQMLAMQAPVSLSPTVTPAKPKPASKPKHPGAKTWIDKSGNVRQVGTGAVLKANPKASNPPTEPAGVVSSGQQVPTGSQVPTNAAQIPGATVYSYDQYGNPVAPTMQQLGVTPTMLQGVEGAVGAADTDGPQMNATNQTSLGLGSTGLGSAVPVLGQPISITPPATGSTATGSTGARQSVANENVTDVSSRNQGVVGGWGGSTWGGVATPYAPYGSSMTGAY